MNRLILISTVLILCSVSCSPIRRIPVEQRDSVSMVIRDSVIYRDSVVFVEVPVEADKAVLPDTDTSRLATMVAESDAWVSDGHLHHILRNRGGILLPVDVKIPERLHHKESYLLKERTEVMEVEKDLTKWQIFSMVFGWLAMAGLAGFLLVRILAVKLKRI